MDREDYKTVHFLEDGQAASRIPEWQYRLRKSRRETLSVLSDAVKKTDTEAFLAGLQALQSDFAGSMRALREFLDGFSVRMLPARTFFVGAEERQEKFALVCRLLCGMETHVQRIHRAAALAVEQERAVAERRTLFSSADCMLREALQAARREEDGQAAEQIARLSAVLLENRERWENCERKTRALRGDLLALSGEILPSFCKRIALAADMEHDGVGCDPVSVARLYGELCAAIEARC